MKYVTPSPWLTWSLSADALVSSGMATLQLLAAGWLAEWLDLPQPLLLGTGAFMVAYVALLVALARSARVPVALIALVIAGNLAWAVGALPLLASQALAPKALGVVFLRLHVVVVLLFAALEGAGLRRSFPDRIGMAAQA